MPGVQSSPPTAPMRRLRSLLERLRSTRALRASLERQLAERRARFDEENHLLISSARDVIGVVDRLEREIRELGYDVPIDPYGGAK